MSDSRRKHLPPKPRASRKRHKADFRPDLKTTKQRRAEERRTLRRETP